MKLKRTGIKQPTNYEIQQMKQSSGEALSIFSKKDSSTSVSCYYMKSSNTIFYFDDIKGYNIKYSFTDNKWRSITTDQLVFAKDIEEEYGPDFQGVGYLEVSFDEIGAIVYSQSYSKKLSENEDFNFGCYLSSTKKIKLNIAKKYSELDFVIVPNLQKKIIEENGVYKPDLGYSGLNEVVVDVYNKNPKYQEKEITPSNVRQEITYDSPNNALSKVIVNKTPIDKIDTITQNGVYTPSEGKFFDEVKVDVFQLNTYDADATENEIFKDKSAYVNGEKVFGKFTINEELNSQEYLIEQIKNVLKTKADTIQPSGTIIINKNGTYNVYDYEFVEINVEPLLENKTVIPSQEEQIIEASSEYQGINQVIVAPALLQEKLVEPTQNAQTITPDDGYYGLSKVDLTEINLQKKTVIPNNEQQTITVDSNAGYLGLQEVIVEPVPTETKTITENGTYTPNIGNFIDSVIVDVQPKLEPQEYTPSSSDINGKIIIPSAGYDGLSQVFVRPVPTEKKAVTENGTVTPSEGKFLSSVEVNVQPPLQDKTVSPSAEGNGVVVAPDNEYYGLKHVIITPIKTTQQTITENGTFVPPEGYFYNLVEVNVPTNNDVYNKQKITVIDYDGTIIEESYLEEGEIYTLPTPPTQSGLTFQKWACPIQIINNQITVENYPVIIAPIYSSTTLKFQIVLNKVTGLSVSIKNISASSLSWGDGSIAGSGSSFTHTYSSYGTYTITISGATTIGSYVFGQSSSAHNFYVKKIWISNNITSIDSNAFRFCETLETVTIPNSITSIGTYAFAYCYNLKTAIIPSSVLNILSYTFAYCYSGLEYAVLDYGLQNIQTYSFSNAGKLHDFIMPNSVTTIGTYITTTCYNLSTFKFSTAITEMPTSSPIGTCYNLEKVILKNTNVTLLPTSFAGNARKMKEFIIPNNVTTINASAFSNCYSLEKIRININKVTTINALFSGCYALKQITLVGGKSVPTLSSASAFNGLSEQLKIVVPDLLYDEFITATNWVNYANYIYKMSEV